LILAELKITSFIIKVWIELPDEDAAAQTGEWQCQITHVESGERRRLKHVREAVYFMLPRLARLGVRLSGWWRLKLWWRQWLGK
jgi:hypothetical protein